MEDTVAAIYERFMQLFPQEKDFWEDLYKDERDHISFLMEAAEGGRFNEMQPDNLGFSMSQLDRTRTFIENISNNIKSNSVSLQDALNMALQIEEAVVEAFTHELIACLSPSDNTTFLQMLMEEKTHIAKIKNMMIEKGFLKLS